MAEIDVLRPEQRAEWQAVLEEAVQYDFYHLPSYHALAEQQGKGIAHLFVCREDAYTLAVPLLLRPIGEALCHADVGEAWWDATCVYGYAGPVASHAEMPPGVLAALHAALRGELARRRVASVFSRLHPLIAQRALLAGLGECPAIGPTVSIDLTLPVDVQRAQYRGDYKRQINKLRRLGARCYVGPDKARLGVFVDIYTETMERVEADEPYYFDEAYFRGLCDALGPRVELFLCELEGEVIAGGLFTLCNGIVQAHLVGSRSEYRRLSPTKLLFDDVRLWGNERGATALHLGGGVGAREDSLYHFKAGFSDRRHTFCTWKWVLEPAVYNQLCEEKAGWSEAHRAGQLFPGYFPAYRCPDCAYIDQPIEAVRSR